jgi:hypothetical protein
MIKAEINNKLESFAGNIAQLKDLAGLQNKQMAENMKKWESLMENSVKLMNQNLRGTAPHLEMSQAGPSRQREYRAPGGYSRPDANGNCFFCGGPHMVRDCPTKDEFIALGWIKIEDKLIKLGDGNWLPKFPEELSKSQRIEDYWKRKGITREIAAARKATLLSSVYPGRHVSFGENYYDTDVIGDLYDTREDEILSANVQNLEARARLAQNPVAQMMQGPVGQFMHGIPLPQHQGGVQPPLNFANPSNSYQGNNLPTAPQPSQNFDMAQLIQLFNAMGHADPTRVDQFVSTRGGAKSDPPANPNF